MAWPTAAELSDNHITAKVPKRQYIGIQSFTITINGVPTQSLCGVVNLYYQRAGTVLSGGQ